ncbi:PfkB family carbohydrate kinase [Spongisporangium articulatum]|uniref:PfkB family carbohydrate kinase n=1 Tax=Spongisporangium articulatum TaxID=3362603 RepID=A0ABW8AQP2_9ACTN
MRAGVFVGLATLDVVHRVARRPAADEKVTALAQSVTAGGPAANAAVTYAALGGTATLVTALGRGPVARVVAEDLRAAGVEVLDVAPDDDRGPPVAAVTVLDGTGERSVASVDAIATGFEPPSGLGPLVAGADVVLVDGHHPTLARAACEAARPAGVDVVVDAGRWKPVFAQVFPLATDVVCSPAFRLDDGSPAGPGLAPTVVVTAGGDPVRWWQGERAGAVVVPAVAVRDTLGAGDVFHGAYAFHRELDLEQRIRRSIALAGERVQATGPQAWRDRLGRRRR